MEGIEEMERTILVTGGAGFMGSNFVKLVYHKYPQYKIIVLDALTYAGNVENLPVNINDTQGRTPRFLVWQCQKR